VRNCAPRRLISTPRARFVTRLDPGVFADQLGYRRGLMVFRRRAKSSSPEPIAGGIDPNAVAAAYRAPIADALRARAQFGQLVDTLRPGPLQERLREMTGRVDAGVDAVWRSAQNATELERVVATLDPDRVADELKRARRSDADESVVAALAARFASTQRSTRSTSHVAASRSSKRDSVRRSRRRRS